MDQAFWPLWELEEVGEDWWWGSNILMRLGLTATTALALWGLATVSPGKGAPGRCANQAWPGSHAQVQSCCERYIRRKF